MTTLDVRAPASSSSIVSAGTRGETDRRAHPRAGARPCSVASFLFVPITPVGPRLIHPAQYTPATAAAVRSERRDRRRSGSCRCARRTERPAARRLDSRRCGTRPRTGSPRARPSRPPERFRRPSGSSRLRATSTASTRSSPWIATGEARNRSRMAFGLPSGSRPAKSAEDLHVALHDVRGGLELGLAGRIEVELGRVDERRRRRRDRPSSPSSSSVHAACTGPRRPRTTISRMPDGDDRLDRRVGRVGGRELLGGQREHARDVERDVPVPDHDRPLVRTGRRRAAGSRGGRCTRRRARSRPTSPAGLRRGSRAACRTASRPHRRPRRRARASSSCPTSRPTSTLPRKRKPGRAAIFSKARETVLSCGWSGATPSRTRPHGVGRRSIMSTSIARILAREQGAGGVERRRPGADTIATRRSVIGASCYDRLRRYRRASITAMSKRPHRPDRGHRGGRVLVVVVRCSAKMWWDSRLPDTYNVMAYGTHDYGGGPEPPDHAGHDAGAGTSVADLHGPSAARPTRASS